MGFFQSCSKYLLLGLNLVFFIISLPMLVLGIWLKVDRSNVHRVLQMIKSDGVVHGFSNLSTGLIDMVAIILIVIGTLTLLIGFCGCCGAIKESKCLLYAYTILVAFIIILQVSVVIVCAVKKDKIRSTLEDQFTKIFQRDYKGIFSPSSSIFSRALGSLMIKLQCCGIRGPSDFTNITSWKSTLNSVTVKSPVACCQFKDGFRLSVAKPMNESYVMDQMVDKKCISDPNNSHVIQTGCSVKIWGLLISRMKIVIAIAICVVLFETICIIFACCVITKSHEKLK